MTMSLLPRNGARGGHRWQTLLGVLRGLLGLALLLAGALDALVTACLGIRPVGPQLLELRDAIADRYRLARAGAHDIEVIDDQDGE
jgi:hypothetical protein